MNDPDEIPEILLQEVETPALEDDEAEVAYDDGEDISDSGSAMRPESGVVPDDPGEE